jgi:universal stress protein A
MARLSRRSSRAGARAAPDGAPAARRFKHILVPIDLSARNARALATALALARAEGARVTLLHVVQRIEDLSATEMQAFARRLERRAAKRLQEAARPFAAAGVPVDGAVLTGVPPREIARFAAAKKADLIVINSHRVEGLARPGHGLGTTSYQVAMLCPCPILLLK